MLIVQLNGSGFCYLANNGNAKILLKMTSQQKTKQ